MFSELCVQARELCQDQVSLPPTQLWALPAQKAQRIRGTNNQGPEVTGATARSDQRSIGAANQDVGCNGAEAPHLAHPLPCGLLRHSIHTQAALHLAILG